MFAAARSTLWASLFCLTLPMAAQGQIPSPPVSVGDTAPAALPDTVFDSVGDRPVELLFTNGLAERVRILTIETERLVVSFLAGGRVVTLTRASVKAVRLLEPPPPPRPRHVGASVSAFPGFTLDMDVRRFHAFANVGVLLSLVTLGGVIPVSIGLGAGLPLWPDSPGLKLDLFVHGNFVGDAIVGADTGFHTGNWLAFGVGLGLHNTWNNGVTLGFALPVFGYSFLLEEPLSHVRDLATGFGYYYATSGEALPAFYIGYRK